MNRLPVAPLFAACWLLASLAASAAPPAPAPSAAAPSAAFKASVAARQSHEECRQLEAGAAHRYHWRTTSPVDFNIHHHHGDAVTYALKRSAMRGDGGTFTATEGGEYCWTWTALNRAATLEGGIR
jgi:hypothetical protein